MSRAEDDALTMACWRYLRIERPDVWRSMLDDGSIRVHCRRRAIEAQIMAEGARKSLWHAVMTGEFSANHALVIPEVVSDIVDGQLRKL